MAQYELATILEHGESDIRNHEDSFYWYMKAALSGHVEAMCNAGIKLLKGIGVEKSIEAGLHLINMAAGRCNYKAIRLLGDIYTMGLYGVEVDRRKGEYWYRKSEAAERNHPITETANSFSKN